MIFQREFNGKMNSDVSELKLAMGDYLYAMNLRIGSSDGQDLGTVTNTKSNIEIQVPSSLSYLFDSSGGTIKIKTIGTCVAEDVKKVYWFTYRSDGRDFILEYNAQNDEISKVFVNLDDSNNINLTNFSLRNRIYSANLVDGTYLKFVDNNRNRPYSIDVPRFKSGYYGVIIDDYIRAAKAPPLTPPIVSYFSDSSASNRLKKKIFQFQTLFTYDSNERSAYSTASVRPFPIDEADPVNDTNPLINNGIQVTFSLGLQSVKSVDLIARYGINNWFLVATFNKSDIMAVDQFGAFLDPGYSSVDNTYTFKFYNDGNYNLVDAAEQALLFDYMPDLAKAQEYANGVLVYGGITEGKDPVAVSGNVFPVYVNNTDVPTISIQAWKTNSKYLFGLVYYDKFDKSGTVNYTPNFGVSTKAFSDAHDTAKPVMNWNITHNPPDWAVKYQWVRTNQLTHQFFLFWRVHTLTLVTQSDKNYYDLYIDTLESFNRANRGSIFSAGSSVTYDWVVGDRVTVHRKDDTTYIDGYDVEILEFQVYSSGTTPLYRLRITQQTAQTISAGALIEIYRPKASPDNVALNVFYEFGQVYDITNPGPSATHSIVSGSWRNGDVFYRQRSIPNEAPNEDITHTYTVDEEYIEDPNFSDSYISNYSDNGRANVIDPNNKKIFIPTGIRFTETYIPGTQINGLSRVYTTSIEQVDRTWGTIQNLQFRDIYLVTFQTLKTGAIPVNSTIITQPDGSQSVLLSEKFLNKIHYYFGDYGIGDDAGSLARKEGLIYYTDPNRGVVLRLDGSGINAISKEADMDNFFTDLLKRYARGNQNINGGFDERFSEYIISFENEDVDIFSLSDESDSEWSLQNPVYTLDRSTFSIVTQPASGSVSVVRPGIARFVPVHPTTAVETFQYEVNDISGDTLATKNLCVNVIDISESVTWIGTNPRCFTVLGVTKKYYLNRQLYYSTGDISSGPVMCDGGGISQINYNPDDISGSTSDPNYVPEVTDNCFCLGDCSGPDTLVTFINNSYDTIIIDGTITLTGHTTLTESGSTNWTIQFFGSGPVKVYIFDCHTVDPLTVMPSLIMTTAGDVYHIFASAGLTVMFTAGSDLPVTC